MARPRNGSEPEVAVPVAAATNSEFWLNRRAHPRQTLVRRSGVLHVDGGTEPCVIVNISAGGLMARTFRPRLPGEAVQVELAPGEVIGGEVLWAQDWTIGIAFAEMIDVKALLARDWVGEHGVDRRRSPRIAIDCPASLRVNARYFYGRIADLSSGGARFRAASTIRRPGPSILTLPDLPPLRARIAWQDGKQCGLDFEEPIPDEALRRWIAARG